MRTIVIGDIHGCYNELKKLMDNLILEEVYNPETDRLIFLGDYIDRGENPRMVIRYVRNLQENNPNVIALMGNHEDMMIDFVDGNYDSGWTWNGNQFTLKSYEGYHTEFLDDVEWARNLPLYFEDENFIYVHAGIDKSKSMKRQSRNTLLWIRENFIYSTKKYKKKVVFGHTPKCYEPYYTLADDVCIDSACVYGGILTALIIEDGEIKEFFGVKKGEADMETIRIIAQAFYGNKTVTEINVEDMDRFILGYLDKNMPITEEISRTIVKVPNTDNLVIVYNEAQEDKYDDCTPLAEIPEENLKIFSRCIACRIDNSGNFMSIEPEDVEIINNYFVA